MFIKDVVNELARYGFDVKYSPNEETQEHVIAFGGVVIVVDFIDVPFQPETYSKEDVQEMANEMLNVREEVLRLAGKGDGPILH